MKRREPEEGAPGGVPGRLRRFVPDEWDAPDIWAKHQAWISARDAWEAEHGEWVECLTELLASLDLVPPEPWDESKI